MAQRRVAVDAVAAHNQRMWDRLATAPIPYTRARGRPPRDRAGKRRFLDRLTNDRIAAFDLDGARVLSLAGGGGWEPILFAELGAETTLFDISARQLGTVRRLARERGTRLRYVQGDMRDLSAFADGSFDLVVQCHSLVFVPDPERVIAEVGRVLARGGTYVASTMHPVTLRLYETGTRDGWRPKRSYFEDGPMPYKDATWQFGSTRIEARTLEYGHRISDLINACAAAGLLVDGFWEWTPDWARTKGRAERGSDAELERLMPAFVELRARKLAEVSRPAARPRVRRAATSRAATRRGTASRSR